MRYVVLCHNCSHGELPCDELCSDQRCPHCGSAPASYADNGKAFCWLHREPLDGDYLVSAHFLFTTYSWRGHESMFPNAKLYEAHEGEKSDGTGDFCCRCQEEYEKWLKSQL